MSKWITCPSCGKPTTVPASEGDGAYISCGCPTGNDLMNRYVPEHRPHGEDAR